MNRKILIIILFICGIGFYFWHYSDSKIITRSTESLVKCFEKDADDGRIGGAMRTSTFRDLLDDRVTFKIERNDIPYASMLDQFLERSELVQMLGGLSQSKGIIEITEKQISILEITDSQAKVKLSTKVKTTKLPKNLDSKVVCEIIFKKIEGDWKVSSLIIAQ